MTRTAKQQLARNARENRGAIRSELPSRPAPTTAELRAKLARLSSLLKA